MKKISDKLQLMCKRLATTGNCRVYTVEQVTATAIVVLVIPKGAEHLDTCNVGGSMPVEEGTDAWGRVDKPMLVLIEEACGADTPPAKMHLVS